MYGQIIVGPWYFSRGSFAVSATSSQRPWSSDDFTMSVIHNILQWVCTRNDVFTSSQ